MRYLLSFLLFLAIPVLGNFPHFNPQTIQDFKGEILSIQTFSFANRPSPHVQVILRTEKGNVSVELGPEWFLDAEGFNLDPGEQLKVRGSLIQLDGHPFIVATKIEKDDYTLELRDEDGLPQWAGWRRQFGGVLEYAHQNVEITQNQTVMDLLQKLEEERYVSEQGNDDPRVKFVLLQGCLERALVSAQASGEIHELVGMIHTPTPATPLCTLPDPVDKTLLDPSIQNEPSKVLTLTSRAQIVRDYLSSGGQLYVVYPKGGLEKRSTEQQEIYLNELKKHPEHLVNCTLETSTIDPEMIGTTYLFKDRENKQWVFSIKARQTNDPQSLSEWTVWFGNLENPQVQQRIHAVMDYFKKHAGSTQLPLSLLSVLDKK